MIKARPYQNTLIKDIVSAWQAVKNVLAVLSTGGGKTVIFSLIIQAHLGACAAVVHRKEIVGQISLALANLGVKHRIVAPPSVVRRIRRRHFKKLGKSYVDPNALCGVASVQTLTSRGAGSNADLQKWIKQVTLCVFDEGHHYINTGKWAKAVRMVEQAKLLFVTATPERADGKGLGSHASGFVEKMVLGPDTAWLIKNKFLSKFKYKAPETNLDMDSIPITASGDFDSKVFRKRVVDSNLIGDCVKHYVKHANGKKTIVFATDVESAEDIAREFNAAGIKAAAVSGQTEQGERDRVLDEFEGNGYDILVNVDLFDEGFDVPAVECVLLARPTESLGKFLQMIGRALRVLEGKEFAVIIDMVRNWERHGMPDWPRRWSLDNQNKQTRKASKELIRLKHCTECTQPYEAFHKACPYCGHVVVPGGRRTPDQVDGDLVELDVEALSALFEKINKADMPEEDYAKDQISRHIPPIGRGADTKRFKAAKYRRQVLRELVAWWVGAQPNRDMSEVHRRFYYRFGIDIGTAFTLNAKDTDSLIEVISQRFAEDLTGQ